MAIVDSVFLSYWRACSLLFFAYMLLKSPESMLYNSYAFLFAQVFDNVVIEDLAEPSNQPILGVIAMLLTLTGLADIVAIFSLGNLSSKPPILDSKNLKDVDENKNFKSSVNNQELYFLYFENLVPLRMIFFLILIGMSYLSDNVYISNNLVTMYGFFEVWFNFAIYNKLRSEKVQRYKAGYYTRIASESDAEQEEDYDKLHEEDDMEIDQDSYEQDIMVDDEDLLQ